MQLPVTCSMCFFVNFNIRLNNHISQFTIDKIHDLVEISNKMVMLKQVEIFVYNLNILSFGYHTNNFFLRPSTSRERGLTVLFWRKRQCLGSVLIPCKRKD